MKKLCVVLVLLLMTLMVQAQDGTICGDVNGDFEVTITDAYLIALFYTNPDLPVSSLPKIADVNADNKIDIVDALLIAQYYVGLIGQLACVDPDPISIDLTGDWRPSTKVDFVLKEDEYAYDFGSNQWVSSITNYRTTEFLHMVEFPTEFSSNSSIVLKSQIGVYPYYEITIFYYYDWSNYPMLQSGSLKIMSSETDSSEYIMSSLLKGTRFSKNSIYFYIDNISFINEESQDTITIAINGKLKETKILEGGVHHRFSYSAYDSIIGFRFIDSINCAAEVVDTDMIYYIDGTYNIFSKTINVSLMERDRPNIERPVIFKIMTDDDTVYLERQVQYEPSVTTIAGHYGITASNIESYSYSIRYNLK